MKTLLYGVTDSAALIYVGSQKVIVNTQTLSTETVNEDADVIEFAAAWEAPKPGDPVRVWEEIASNSLSRTIKDTEDVAVLSASANVSRAYTVPSRVVANARGVSPTARLTPTAGWMKAKLSSGRQVSLQTLAYMERFFDAHAADRVDDPVWNAWGGNAGRNWVRSTFARIDTITASVPEAVNLSAFSESAEDAHTFWAEQSHVFTAQVVALYQLTPAGTWLAWGDGDWINCEPSEQDRLVQVDDETAIYVAGALFDAPERAVDLRNLDPEEWDLAADGYEGTDWEMVDMVAAAPNLTPGQYTPEERSKNATGQLRDANGRFAKAGDTGAMQSGVAGTIERVDQSTGNLIVADANGNRYLVPANSFKVGGPGTVPPPKPSGAPDPITGTPGSQLPPLDLDEILAEPRVTGTTPKAWLKKLLQPMAAAQLNQVLGNYSQFIHDERQRRGHDFQPNGGFLDPSDPHPRRTEKIENHLERSIRRHDRKADNIYDRLHHRHGVASDDGVTAAGDPNGLEPTSPEMPARPDPETSDVPAMHLAIVDKDDARAVTDLVALVPATSTSTEPALFRRVAGSWIEDVKLLGDMRSPTPPAVVKLTDADYEDVLKQVDSETPDDSGRSTDPSQPAAAPAAAPAAPPATPVPAAAAASGVPPESDTVEYVAVWDNAGLPVYLIAAFTAAGEGGLDRNRGGAEKLRRYWLFGPGALKIRWNTPGDWTRCVRHLEKYLGPRAKGYCQLRHHEATGMWTGDQRNRAGFSYTPGGEQHFTTDHIRCHDDIILTAAAKARHELAIAKVQGTMNTPDGPTLLGRDDAEKAGGGKEFTIPLVIPEGVESGDGRTFDKGALTMRDLPLPLMWQFQTGDGHDGSVLVGRIDHVERTADGLGNARGVFDTGPYGKEAQRLVENEMLRWVSADLDQFEAEQTQPEGDDDDETGAQPKMGAAKLSISKGRLMGITLVPKPAFQEALIALAQTENEVSVEDGAYVGEPVVSEAEQIVASAGIAEAIPVEPPSVWFNRPPLNGPTPVTVTDEGQVYGHIATWDTDHIGLPAATRAPRSSSSYAYFHTGALRCADGADVHVGQLTLAGGHADMLADASSAVRHYDDTGSAVADVHIGEDSYGIWCAGALRPGTTPEQIRALRASAPSGDWRRINGRLELVAVCQVNVPGFPVPRAQVASGAVCALVAAGTAALSKLRAHPMDELDLRLQDLERRETERATLRAAGIRERMEPVLQQQAAARAEMETLAAAARTRVYKVLDVDGYLTEFKDFSPDKRKKLAGEKKALPDGSFPIENASDLRRAILAYGRADESKRARVRRHIVRCARGMGKTNVLPDDWSENALNDLALFKMDSQETITASLTARANEIRARVVREEPTDGTAG